MASMNRYVGTANAVPDSFVPRRFSAMSSRTRTDAASASWPTSHGMAEVAFCTPEEIDTATVRT